MSRRFRRCDSVPWLATIVLLSVSATTSDAAPRVRPNIKSLDASSQAIQDFLYAFDKLGQKPATDMDSLAILIRLHNRGPLPNGQMGACVHGDQHFLPWHRLLLFEFERALRESDPPRTANVTLPYWNFMEGQPTGHLFPPIFEDPTSPLWIRRRLQPIASPGVTPLSPATIAALEADRELKAGEDERGFLMGLGNYADFGGPDDDSGLLEVRSHNYMHTWVGHGANLAGQPSGDMSTDVTAARDPIFWCYHGYIDLLWDEWQQRRNARSDTAAPDLLPGDLDHSFTQFKNPKTVRQLLNVEDDLDYKYEGPTPPVAPPVTPFVQEVVQLPMAAAAAGATSAAKTFKLPESTWRRPADEKPLAGLQLQLDEIEAPQDRSWQVEFFVHPENVEFKPQDPQFRKQYFAGYAVKWQHAEHVEGTEHATGHEHQARAPRMAVPIRPDFLRKMQASDAPWVVSPNVEVIAPAGDEVQPDQPTAKAAAEPAPITYSGVKMTVRVRNE